MPATKLEMPYEVAHLQEPKTVKLERRRILLSKRQQENTTSGCSAT
jgi:hypothetical protein